jgi:hypothetical protein
MHGKGTASIIASTKFLISYAESLQVGRQGMTKEPDDKGKAKVHEGRLGSKALENRLIRR